MHKILNQEKRNGQPGVDVLKINQLWRQLFFQSYIWRRLRVWEELMERWVEGGQRRWERGVKSIWGWWHWWDSVGPTEIFIYVFFYFRRVVWYFPVAQWSKWTLLFVHWPIWDLLLFLGQIDTLEIVWWPKWPLTLNLIEGYFGKIM